MIKQTTEELLEKILEISKKVEIEEQRRLEIFIGLSNTIIQMKKLDIVPGSAEEYKHMEMLLQAAREIYKNQVEYNNKQEKVWAMIEETRADTKKDFN